MTRPYTFPFMPDLCCLNHNAFLYLLSKQFLRSTKATYKRLFTKLSNENIASTFDLFFLKPNEASESVQFTSKKRSMRLFKAALTSLEKHPNKVMPR